MGVTFVIMWQLYRDSGVDYNFTYFMLWSFAFYLGLTIFSVPYVAMGDEMSEDFHERTNIMAIAQWIGQWAWVIAPWFWVIMYDKGWFESADVATRSLAIWVGIGCMILAMIPAIFIKSKSTLNEDYAPLTIGNIGGSIMEIFDGFVEAFKSPPFRKLCIATFFIFNAFNTVAAFSFFIVVYYLFSGDAGAAGIWPTLFGSLGALITTFAVIPTVAWMSKKMEKKNAFLISQGISIIGYVMLWFLFVPGKPYMFIFALPFFSFGIGSLFVLMMSMTADVIDLDELNTGKRREGIFGAIYWWMVKFGFAIAGGLSGLILTYVGFDSTPGAVQTEDAITGLRLFFSAVPIIGTVIAIVVMWNYSVSEARANEIRAELDDRKNSDASSKTPVYYNQKDRPLALTQADLDETFDVDLSSLSIRELKNAFRDTLNNGMHGLCFSPYKEGQNIGDQLSEAQINERMQIIRPFAKWVRSFSCTDGNEHIPKVAHASGIKTMVGAWIGKDKENNEKELAALIKLANTGVVNIAVVGNETLLRNELTEREILSYIKRVKKAIPNIPVGYVDAYYQFIDRPALVEACDVILINCYPFWEGFNVKHAELYLKKMYELTTNIADGKPVIITETGWPNKGEAKLDAIPSTENAIAYYIKANTWANDNNIQMFYFSSFNESWKVHHEGDVGQRWGIWDKHEKLKYV